MRNYLDISQEKSLFNPLENLLVIYDVLIYTILWCINIHHTMSLNLILFAIARVSERLSCHVSVK